MRLKSVSKSKLSAALITSLVVALGYQNCSKVTFKAIEEKPLTTGNLDHSVPDSQPTPKFDSTAPLIGASSIVINQGASYTKDLDVMLAMSSENADEMRISDFSDCTDGAWEPLSDKRGWKLSDSNRAVSVYAKFRNKGGRESPCISTSIVHDNIAPVAKYESEPVAFSNQVHADFAFSGTDEGSGLDRLECRLDSGAYAACVSPMRLAALPAGARKLQLRAVDRAGNVSLPLERPWVVDLIKPSIQITKAPLSPSRVAAASFEFTVTDSGGSQVDPQQIVCRYQHESNSASRGVIQSCQSPANLSGLLEGNYLFEIVATDRAGNVSNTASHTWLIDTLPPGAFSISGITGGSDATIDGYLASVAQPTVHWSLSSGAAGYSVEIRNSAGSGVVCPAKSTTALSYGFAASECTLANGVSYQARVVASDAAGNTISAPNFPFAVDLSPPVIAIQNPVMGAAPTARQISFSITDVTSGVREATCHRTFNQQTETRACTELTSISYSNLPAGQHSFSISAVDRAGNSVTSGIVSFTIVEARLVEHTAQVALPPSKVDVLVVVDNSGSMDADRRKLGSRLASFTNQLGNLDWQICVTTTEPTQDGKLVPFKGTSLYAINKNTANYNTLFLNTVAEPPKQGTSGNEQGILATVRATETKDARCIRNDAAFSVVVISDEDEASTGGWPEFQSNNQFKELGTKNYPETAMSTVASSMGLQKVFTFHSLVIRSGDTACYNEQKIESAVFYGRRYEALSGLSNGLVGNICAADYGAELQEFAKRIERHMDSISMECQPYQGKVEVKVNGQLAAESRYSVEGNKVKFTPSLTPGTTVALKYYCQQ